MQNKITAAARGRLCELCPIVPQGFYCEGSAFERIDAALDEFREAMLFANELAAESGEPCRCRVEIYGVGWPHEDLRWRLRISDWIFEKLVHLRASFRATKMTEFRIRVDAARHIERLLVGRQRALVEAAIASAHAQRPAMRTHDELDFEPIDAAIAAFRPGWDSPQSSR